MFVSLLCCDVQHRTIFNSWSITTKLVAQRCNQCMCLVRARYCRFEALTTVQLLGVFGSGFRRWKGNLAHCNKGVVLHLLSFTIRVRTFVVKFILVSALVAACLTTVESETVVCFRRGRAWKYNNYKRTQMKLKSGCFSAKETSHKFYLT